MVTDEQQMIVLCDDPRHHGAQVIVRRFRRRDDLELARSGGGQRVTGQAPARWSPVEPSNRPKARNAPGTLVLGPLRKVANGPLSVDDAEQVWKQFTEMRPVQPIECRGCRKSRIDPHRAPVSVVANLDTLDVIFERTWSIGRTEISLRELAEIVGEIGRVD